MSIRLTGQLLSPTDGSPAANGQIRFISLQGTGKVPKGAIAIEAADANGDYDFTLEFGRFSVEIRQADKFVKQGAVSVNSDTPTPMEIGQLLEYTEPLTPSQIAYVEELTEQAESYAQAASVSQSAANASAMSASDSAVKAEYEADRASEITGLDTVEEAIDLTLSKTLGIMSLTEHESALHHNESLFSACGFTHYGKSLNVGIVEAINEGMMVVGGSDAGSSIAGNVALGIEVSNSKGASELGFPEIHIAGATTLLSAESDSYGLRYHLPPAADATVVYDSSANVRGASNVTKLDLKVDPDPKYGSAPTGTEDEILREGIARAFEGVCKNGDMRNGNSGEWATLNVGSLDIANGKATYTSDGVSGNARMRQLISKSVLEVGAEYILKMTLDEISVDNPNAVAVHAQGSTSYGFVNTPVAGDYELRFTVPDEAAATMEILIQIGADLAGDYVVTSNWSVRKVTEEVVIDRQDILGLEQFSMIIRDGEIFDIVGSRSLTFGNTDVPTVLSTKPLSFFQQYDGQFADPSARNDRYRCVVWDDLTDEQKSKVAAFMGERLWINKDGYLKFTTIRPRVEIGQGNGDWFQIDPTASGGAVLQFGSNGWSRVAIQAHRDEPIAGVTSDFYSVTGNTAYNFDPKVGVFTSRYAQEDDSPSYYYVVGTLNRLNQGARHPSFNPQGAARFAYDIGSAGTVNSGTKWYTSNLRDELKPKSLKDCFGDWLRFGEAISKPSRFTHFTSAFVDSGTMASGLSGREDGRYFDAAYEGGQGGVIDFRLSAYDMGAPEEAAKIWEKVKDGSYRGLESLVHTKVHKFTVSLAGNYAGGSYVRSDDIEAFNDLGDKKYSMFYNETKGAFGWVSCMEPNNVYLNTSDLSKLLPNIAAASGGINLNPYTGSSVGDVIYLITGKEINVPVSGDFEMMDVLGSPVDIYNTYDLSQGWYGLWAGMSGTANTPASRKRIGSGDITCIYSDDLGDTWTRSPWGFDNVGNFFTGTLNPSYIGLMIYTAFAKQTVESENKLVFNGDKGVGSVYAMSNYHNLWGSLLAESLISKVLKSSNDPRNVELSLITKVIRNDNGELLSGDSAPTHAKLTLGQANNNSQAVKALPYQIADGGRCSIAIHANELTWVSGAPTFISGEVSNSYTEGERYRVDFGETRVIYTCTASATFTAADLVQRADGSLINSSDQELLRPLQTYQGSWGDDDSLKITDSGYDLFIDLNENLNISTAHKLAISYGWVKNRARAGEQVEGVDL